MSCALCALGMDNGSGNKPKFQVGRASEADSVAVMKSAIAVSNYYNKTGNYKRGYTIPGGNSFGWSLDRDFSSFSKDPITIYPTKSGKVATGKIPISMYRKVIDANRFYQREGAYGILDTRAPMTLFDRRIAPQKYSSWENINKNDSMFRDGVATYEYDPIAVKPVRMRTAADWAYLKKEYGITSSVGKSTKPVIKSTVNSKPQVRTTTKKIVLNTKPVVKPTIAPILPQRVPLGKPIDMSVTQNSFADLPQPKFNVPQFQQNNFPQPYAHNVEVQYVDKTGKPVVSTFGSQVEADAFMKDINARGLSVNGSQSRGIEKLQANGFVKTLQNSTTKSPVPLVRSAPVPKGYQYNPFKAALRSQWVRSKSNEVNPNKIKSKALVALKVIQKKYPTSGTFMRDLAFMGNNIGTGNKIPLTQGRYNTGVVDSGLIDEIGAAAKRQGIDPYLLAGLIGRESTFGNNNSRGFNYYGLTSGWNVLKPYTAIDPLQFLADKKVPGIKVMKSNYGWGYDIEDATKVDSYFAAHPELAKEYEAVVSKTPVVPKGQNFLDLTARWIKEKGVGSYNPGDSGYAQKVQEDVNLLRREKGIVFKQDGGFMPKLQVSRLQFIPRATGDMMVNNQIPSRTQIMQQAELREAAVREADKAANPIKYARQKPVSVSSARARKDWSKIEKQKDIDSKRDLESKNPNYQVNPDTGEIEESPYKRWWDNNGKTMDKGANMLAKMAEIGSLTGGVSSGASILFNLTRLGVAQAEKQLGRSAITRGIKAGLNKVNPYINAVDEFASYATLDPIGIMGNRMNAKFYAPNIVLNSANNTLVKASVNRNLKNSTVEAADILLDNNNIKTSGFFNIKGAFQKYPKGPLTAKEIELFKNTDYYKTSLENHLADIEKYKNYKSSYQPHNYADELLNSAIKGDVSGRSAVNHQLYGGHNWQGHNYLLAGIAGTAYPGVASLYASVMTPPAVKNKILSTTGLSNLIDYGTLSNRDTSIDITNRNMDYAKINETKDGKVILGGEFIENANNTVRKAKDWLVANDTYSDKNYPSKDIKSFYGIEKGKFKTGPASDFDPNTEIVPRRFGQANIDKAVMNLNEMRLLDKKGNPIYQNTPNTGKFILYSPSTKKSEFVYINSGKSGVDKVNKFLKKNKDAEYIHMDNGRYEYYGLNPNGLNNSDFTRYYEQDLQREGKPGYNLILKQAGGFTKTAASVLGVQPEKKAFQSGGLWNTNRTKFVDSTLNANRGLDFVKRLYQKNTPSIQIPGELGRSTHFMKYDPGTRRVYPSVVNQHGNLRHLLGGDAPWDYADNTGEYITFPTVEQAQWFGSDGYKQGTGVLKSFRKPKKK